MKRPTTMMLVTIARGEGVYLDRFRPSRYDTNRDLPIYVRPWRGHVLSRYPTAPAILVQPFVLPLVWHSLIGFDLAGTDKPRWPIVGMCRSPGSR